MVDLRVQRCIRNVGVGKCWVDGECSEGGKGTVGAAKIMTKDYSESLISSGALSSLEASSESITSTWGVCAIVIMLVSGRCGLGVVGVWRVEVVIGGFRLVFKAPL